MELRGWGARLAAGFEGVEPPELIGREPRQVGVARVEIGQVLVRAVCRVASLWQLTLVAACLRLSRRWSHGCWCRATEVEIKCARPAARVTCRALRNVTASIGIFRNPYMHNNAETE